MMSKNSVAIVDGAYSGSGAPPASGEIDFNVTNFALLLLQRLGSGGVDVMEWLIRGDEPQAGITGEGFIAAVTRCLHYSTLLPDSPTFPWQRKCIVDAQQLRSYTAEEVIGGFVPDVVTDHKGLNFVDVARGYAFHSGRSKQIAAREGNMSRWMNRIQQLKGGTSTCAAELTSFDSPDSLRYALSALFMELDRDHRDRVSWEQVAAYFADVTSQGKLSFGDKGIPSYYKTFAREMDIPENRHRLNITMQMLPGETPPPQIRIVKACCAHHRGRIFAATENAEILFLDSNSLEHYHNLNSYKSSNGQIVSMEYAQAVAMRSVLAVGSSDSSLRFFSVDRDEEVQCTKFGTPQAALKFLQPLHTFISGSRSGVISATRWETVKQRWRSQMFSAAFRSSITSFCYAPSKSQLVASMTDGVVQLFDFDSRKPLNKMVQPHAVHCLDHSENFNIIAIGDAGPSPMVWVPGDNRCVAEALVDAETTHNGGVLSVKFVHNTPQLFTLDGVGVIKLWDLRTMRCVETMECGFHNPVHFEYFDKFSRFLVFGPLMVEKFSSTAEPPVAADPQALSFLTSVQVPVESCPPSNFDRAVGIGTCSLVVGATPHTLSIWSGVDGQLLDTLSVVPLAESDAAAPCEPLPIGLQTQTLQDTSVSRRSSAVAASLGVHHAHKSKLTAIECRYMRSAELAAEPAESFFEWGRRKNGCGKPTEDNDVSPQSRTLSCCPPVCGTPISSDGVSLGALRLFVGTSSCELLLYEYEVVLKSSKLPLQLAVAQNSVATRRLQLSDAVPPSPSSIGPASGVPWLAPLQLVPYAEPQRGIIRADGSAAGTTPFTPTQDNNNLARRQNRSKSPPFQLLMVCGENTYIVQNGAALEYEALFTAEPTLCGFLWEADGSADMDLHNMTLFAFLSLVGNAFVFLSFDRTDISNVRRSVRIQSFPESAVPSVCTPFALYSVVMSADSAGGIQFFSFPVGTSLYPTCIARTAASTPPNTNFSPRCTSMVIAEHQLLYCAAGLLVTIYDMTQMLLKSFPSGWKKTFREPVEFSTTQHSVPSALNIADDRAVDEMLSLVPPTPSVIHSFSVGDNSVRGNHIVAMTYVCQKRVLLICTSDGAVHITSLWGAPLGAHTSIAQAVPEHIEGGEDTWISERRRRSSVPSLAHEAAPLVKMTEHMCSLSILAAVAVADDDVPPPWNSAAGGSCASKSSETGGAYSDPSEQALGPNSFTRTLLSPDNDSSLLQPGSRRSRLNFGGGDMAPSVSSNRPSEHSAEPREYVYPCGHCENIIPHPKDGRQAMDETEFEEMLQSLGVDACGIHVIFGDDGEISLETAADRRRKKSNAAASLARTLRLTRSNSLSGSMLRRVGLGPQPSVRDRLDLHILGRKELLHQEDGVWAKVVREMAPIAAKSPSLHHALEMAVPQKNYSGETGAQIAEKALHAIRWTSTTVAPSDCTERPEKVSNCPVSRETTASPVSVCSSSFNMPLTKSVGVSPSRVKVDGLTTHGIQSKVIRSAAHEAVRDNTDHELIAKGMRERHLSPRLTRRVFHQRKSELYYREPCRWDFDEVEREANRLLTCLVPPSQNKLFGTRKSTQHVAGDDDAPPMRSRPLTPQSYVAPINRPATVLDLRRPKSSLAARRTKMDDNVIFQCKTLQNRLKKR